MSKRFIREPLMLLGVVLASAACGRPPGPVPQVPSLVVGHCKYVNNFSGREECREYLGTGWSDQRATNDCSSRGSTIALGQRCNYPAILGECLLSTNSPDVVRISFPGTDATRCGGSRTGCEFFGGGYFLPAPVCEGVVTNGSGLPVFQQPTQTCKDPIAGEPRGQSANGQVCTWNAISASTEEGRKFKDYGSCDMVRTQRPYYPVQPAPARSTDPDPRLQDPAYMSELTWVKSQIESSACVCCHSTAIAPRGASNWYIEAPGNFMDTFYDTGLALGAGWVDSRAFGAYPPAENNNFARTTSGFPSTDPARMARFFANELTHRGKTQADFATTPPFGGPIYTQLVYQPTACAGGEGVAADGTITWNGGTARYIYVLETGSANPGVPPNLDLPTGTLWRLDVGLMSNPLSSGVKYGEIPTGTTQRFPATGSAPMLTSGRQYYLYVLQDVGIPITRCLFNYTR